MTADPTDPARTAWLDQLDALFREADAEAERELQHPRAEELQTPPLWMVAALTAAGIAVASGQAQERWCAHVRGPGMLTTCAWGAHVYACRRPECETALQALPGARAECDQCHAPAVAGIGRVLYGPLAVLYRLCPSCLQRKTGARA
ncbi:hypothetical protein [Kineococcus radiotolerans]|nr:hypothetical protein [Kineococcus radiotolerans]